MTYQSGGSMFKPFDVDALVDKFKDIKAPERKERVSIPKVGRPKKEGSTAPDIQIKSDFKSIRHLVEYMLVKNKDIRFDHVEKIVKKAFPGQAFDVGMFTWFKLEYVKNGKLLFRAEIEAQNLLDTPQ
jgi:hypothetical protein